MKVRKDNFTISITLNRIKVFTTKSFQQLNIFGFIGKVLQIQKKFRERCSSQYRFCNIESKFFQMMIFINFLLIIVRIFYKQKPPIFICFQINNKCRKYQYFKRKRLPNRKLTTMIIDETQFQCRYTCPICQECATDAVETECCGKFLCQKCYYGILRSNKRCMFRCLGNFKAHPSINARRDIKNTKFDCKFKCGIKFLIKDKENHENICEQITKMLKQPKRIFEVQTALALMWGQLFFQQNDNKSIKIKNKNQQNSDNSKILTFLSQYLLNFSIKLSKTLKNQTVYWYFYCQNNNSEYLILALTILYKLQKNYLLSIKHLTKLLQISKNEDRKMILFELFERQVEAAIQSKIDKKDLIDICQQYLYRLNHKKQSDIIPIAVCLNCLIRLSIALKDEHLLQIYVVFISILQDDINFVLNKHLEMVCAQTSLISNNSTQKIPLYSTEKLSQARFKIFINMNWIRYILCLKKGSPKYFYNLFQKSQVIFVGKEIYSNRQPRPSQQEIIKQAINAYNSIIQDYGKYLVKVHISQCSQFLSKRSLRHTLFKLYCYLICCKRFKHSEFTINNYIQKIRKVIIENYYDESEKTKHKNIQQLKKNKPTHLKEPQKLVQIQLSADEKNKVYKIARDQITIFSLCLRQALMCMGEENINYQNQFLLLYTIYNTILQTIFLASQQLTILYFQMVYYFSKSSYIKGKDRQNQQSRSIIILGQNIFSFVESTRKGRLDQEDLNPFIEQAIQNILENHAFELCLQNKDFQKVNIENTNFKRRGLYSSQKIRAILLNFVQFLFFSKKRLKTVSVNEKKNKNKE